MVATVIQSALIALSLTVATSVEGEEMPAGVGRISYGEAPRPGAAICTGVLVAPDLVLTAAHCVRDAVQRPEAIRFDAGWSGTYSAGQRQGAAVILAGEAPEPGVAGLATDVALVVLDQAYPRSGFPPLPLAAPAHGPFTLIGFDRTAPDRPMMPAICRSVATLANLIALDCAVRSGNSGAPLLQRHGDDWTVVATIVASAEGGTVRSWATVPPPGWNGKISRHRNGD